MTRPTCDVRDPRARAARQAGQGVQRRPGEHALEGPRTRGPEGARPGDPAPRTAGGASSPKHPPHIRTAAVPSQPKMRQLDDALRFAVDPDMP